MRGSRRPSRRRDRLQGEGNRPFGRRLVPGLADPPVRVHEERRSDEALVRPPLPALFSPDAPRLGHRVVQVGAPGEDPGRMVSSLFPAARGGLPSRCVGSSTSDRTHPFTVPYRSSRRSWRMVGKRAPAPGRRLEPTVVRWSQDEGSSGSKGWLIDSRADPGLRIRCSRPSRRRTLNEGDSRHARAALVLTADTCGPIGGVARRKGAIGTTTYSPLRHRRWLCQRGANGQRDTTRCRATPTGTCGTVHVTTRGDTPWYESSCARWEFESHPGHRAGPRRLLREPGTEIDEPAVQRDIGHLAVPVDPRGSLAAEIPDPGFTGERVREEGSVAHGPR